MRITITFVLVSVAVLAQATVINRLPFDWNALAVIGVDPVARPASQTSPLPSTHMRTSESKPVPP